MTTSPRLGYPELEAGETVPEDAVNTIGRYIESGAGMFNCVSIGDTSPPGSPADGAMYILGASATGAWSGFASGSKALYIEDHWVNIVSREGDFAYSQTANTLYKNDGSGGVAAWVAVNTGNPTESIIIACSDETSAIVTGNAKVTFRMPYAFTLSAVRASVTTAPTGSTIIIDINEGGSTILSTKLSIDAGEKTSTTAASAAVISDTALANDAEITIDFDQVGSTIAGAGVKVYLIGTRT